MFGREKLLDHSLNRNCKFQLVYNASSHFNDVIFPCDSPIPKIDGNFKSLSRPAVSNGMITVILRRRV